MAFKINEFQFKSDSKNTENKSQLFGGGENSLNNKLLIGGRLRSTAEDEDLRDQNPYRNGFRITRNLRSLGITGI